MAAKRTNRSAAKRASAPKQHASKKSSVSKASALKAAAKAKEVFAGKGSKTPRSWERGGREWSRALGHFGVAVK